MAVAAVLLILLLAAAVFVNARLYQGALQATLHTYAVREQLLDVVNHMHVSEMEARSYGLSGRDIAFQRYWRDMAEVDADLHRLATLVADDPVQAASVAKLRSAIETRRARFEKILGDYRTHGPAAAQAGVFALVAESGQPVRDIATRMLEREAVALRTRETASERQGRVVAGTAAAALFGCLALLAAALINSVIERRHRLRGERALAENAEHLEKALEVATRAEDTLRRLSKMAELLQNCRDLGEATGVIERALPPLLPTVSGCLALVNASRNIVEARMQWGDRGPELGDAVFAPEDCWALRRSQPHPRTDQATAPVCAHLVEAGVTAGNNVCLPLNAHGQALGVLTLCADEPIGDGTRRLAETISDQLALALGNLQLQASLRIQSIRDPLTNLFNRRYLEESLPREILRAERRKGGLSVLMFDLDHFKHYNDTQGHDGGDALLAAFGSLLAQSCRGEDMPCRFGGEEFAVVLTDANHDRGLERAEAIRHALSELTVHYRTGTLPPATVSVGVASYPEHGSTPEVLIRAADRALYRAKQLGRNRVASANDASRSSVAAGTPGEA